MGFRTHEPYFNLFNGSLKVPVLNFYKTPYMKTILISFILLFSSAIVIPSENPDNQTAYKLSGIQFHGSSWDEALKLAKAENKLIFLDLYATWCGPCKMLDKNTFPDKAVGDFYNKNFINIHLDGEKGEGLMLARQYQIKGYPTLLFIDSNGKAVLHTAGYRGPEDFLNLGQEVKNQSK